MSAPAVAICCDLHSFRCLDEPCCRRCVDKPMSVGGALGEVSAYLGYVSGREQRSSEVYRAIYLNSPHWRSRRLVALQKADWTCAGCGLRSRRLDVHHLTYERIGQELDEDLEVNCRACHEKEHAH